MEYAIGRQLHAERGDDGFRVYTFVCPEDFPYDVSLDADGQLAAPEPEEKARLQCEHRAALLGGKALYRAPRDAAQLQASILALREEVLALRREQAAVREEVRGARKSILGVLALVIVLLAAIGGGLWWMKHRQSEDARKVIAGQKQIADGQKLIIEGPKITTAGIRKQILLGSEKKRDRDLAEADGAAPIEREKLREAALKAHELRISRIDELAASFTELEGRADATAVFKEMSRILEQEGVDMALAYVAEQKGGILERIRKRKETEKQQTRTELQPLLSAAGLQASAGQSVAARASYKQILALDPDWPEALNAFGWFLYNQSVEMDRNSTLAAAFADAEEAHSFATRWHETGPVVAGARRLLTATNSQMGTVLLKRGQAGDADKALAHYTRSLELAEKLLTDYPAWALAKHDVSSSSEKLGDFLSKRGQPGDADAAFKHYTRENEIFWMLLVETPDSAEARRDAAMSLGKLGELLTERAQPGDKDKAFDYLTRFVEQCEKLLADNPDSAKARRDAYISLQKLGDFLAERAQPGDKDKALDDFTRSLELAEKLLAETPDSTEAKLDVASCQDRLGLFLAERGQPGDADAALKHYTRENEMTEKLLAENPGSAEAKHAVAVSVQRFGDLLVKRGRPGDADKAIDNFTRSLALREKLLTDNPNSVQAVRDVCMGLDKLGELLTQRAQPGDADKALTQYTRSLELREKLLADNPGSTDTKRDVCMGLENLGEFLIKRGQPGDADKAHAYYDRSLEIEAKLLTENPGSAWAVEDVVGSHSKLAGFAAKLGDKKGEALHRHIIFDLLKPYVERGGTFDPATMKLYGEVKAEFAK